MRKNDLFLMREKVTYTRSTVWFVTHEAPPASEGRRRKWIALLAKFSKVLARGLTDTDARCIICTTNNLKCEIRR